MTSKVIRLLLLIQLASCSSTGTVTPRFSDLKSPSEIAGKRVVVFVPGYKGSVLIEKTSGDPTWITSSQALFGNKSIALPSFGALKDEAYEFRVDGVLGSVPIVGNLISKKFYSRCIKNLKSKLGETFIVLPFGFDWRKSNVDSAIKLSEFIDSLIKEDPKSIDIVTHSMGGIVTAYYLRYGSQKLEQLEETWAGAKKIRRVVILGAPFQGVEVMFRDMQKGSTTGLNEEIITGDAIASFPSAYELLPYPQLSTLYHPQKPRINSQTIFVPSNWKKYSWGGLVKQDQLSEDEISSRYAFIEQSLQSASRLATAISTPSEPRLDLGLKVLNIRGTGQKTLVAGVFDNGRLEFDPDETEIALAGDGDATVSHTSSRLPPAYRHYLSSEILVEALHPEVCSANKSMEALIPFLARE